MAPKRSARIQARQACNQNAHEDQKEQPRRGRANAKGAPADRRRSLRRNQVARGGARADEAQSSHHGENQVAHSAPANVAAPLPVQNAVGGAAARAASQAAIVEPAQGAAAEEALPYPPATLANVTATQTQLLYTIAQGMTTRGGPNH